MAGEVARRPRKIKRVEITRLDKLISGELTVEDLDDEEIQRMQLRNNQGDFRGRAPLYIPRELAMAFRQEHFRRFSREMQEMTPIAIKAIKELATSRHLMPGDATRLRAAELILERNFGKVTQSIDSHVTVDKGKTFDDFVGEAIIDVEEDDE
ncbi:hypothetical protein SEA_SPARCETUS_4 [Microbacterium phage Sparcetus]|nr:hypothetical protein SEA_SPARCETUS_4 [Microbacterium phage Sparcetus]